MRAGAKWSEFQFFLATRQYHNEIKCAFFLGENSNVITIVIIFSLKWGTIHSISQLCLFQNGKHFIFF